MKRVWFKAVSPDTTPSEISGIARSLLQRMVNEEGVKIDPRINIKVHFGEKGNITFLDQTYYHGVIDYLQEQGCEPSYIETNVLYRGERTTRESHLRLAKEHGFDRLPIIIADGEHGEEYVEVPIKGKHFTSCKVAKGVVETPQMLVLSHFKGHYFAGFGGALKQLSMGCASRGGKMDQHAGNTPFIVPFTCRRCGLCARKCPVSAIKIGIIPKIDKKKCLGCAACLALCPRGAIAMNGLTSLTGSFFERLAEYAVGASQGKPHLYVSFAVNITRGCDCGGSKMKPVIPNIGVLASNDPVAIDSACLSLLKKHGGPRMFHRGRRTLEHAQKLQLGSMAYQLVIVE